MTEQIENYFYLVGLGSNIDPKIDHIRTATQELTRQFNLVSTSELMFNDPIGGIAAGNFVNSVVLIDTQLLPLELILKLLEIEAKIGRKRLKRWGDRAIDLDILYAWHSGKAVRSSNCDCIVPHPFFFERNFALDPAREALEIAQKNGINLTIEL